MKYLKSASRRRRRRGVLKNGRSTLLNASIVINRGQAPFRAWNGRVQTDEGVQKALKNKCDLASSVIGLPSTTCTRDGLSHSDGL